MVETGVVVALLLFGSAKGSAHLDAGLRGGRGLGCAHSHVNAQVGQSWAQSTAGKGVAAVQVDAAALTVGVVARLFHPDMGEGGVPEEATQLVAQCVVALDGPAGQQVLAGQSRLRCLAAAERALVRRLDVDEFMEAKTHHGHDRNGKGRVAQATQLVSTPHGQDSADAPLA